MVAVFVGLPAWTALTNRPHYALYTNALAADKAGYYFPHDEFYDASMRDVMNEIARRARSGARVASESPSLASHYAGLAQRTDLVCVSLSDPEAVKQLAVGDFIIIARGRRYFSNDAIINTLRDQTTPLAEFTLGSVPSAKLYELDANILSRLVGTPLNGAR